jgi:uncharacterized protein YoxC
MKSLLKTVVAAATVGAVFAGAVIFYVDHKIDQVTQAVVAPFTETGERVGGAVEGVERSVSSFIDTGAEVVDDVADELDTIPDTVGSTMNQLSESVERTGEAVTAVVETSTERAQQAFQDTRGEVIRLWDMARSELADG